MIASIAELNQQIEEARAVVGKALEALIANLELSSSEDEECPEFAGLVSAAQRLLDLDDLDMSRVVKVSRPTISRWTRGVTSPHPIARKAIFNVLIKKAQAKAKSMRG